MDVLKNIVDIKKMQLEAELVEYKDFHALVDARDFYAALRAQKTAIIAEIKYASPAKGDFGVKYLPQELASLYEAGGAVALSVLACKPFFNGSPSYITEAKMATKLPVLWKDFVFDSRQLELAKRCGADAVLLMCAVVGSELAALVEEAKKYGLEPVVEIYCEEELAEAKASGTKIILINNRNLHTLKVDLEVSQRLVKSLPEEIAVISASGIQSRQDIELLQAAGINAFLVGESVSRADDPQAAIDRLRGR